MTLQIVPESAPFSPEQRAWLNGFLAGMLGVLDEQNTQGGSTVAMAAAAKLLSPPSGAILQSANDSDESEVFPWHDSALPMVDRIQLAKDRPVERQLMAAMAQLDCGSCGYLCKTYAEAIATGVEKNLTLCSPGGSETAKMLRQIKKSVPSSISTAGTSIAATEVAKLQNKVDEIAKIGTRNQPVSAKWIRSLPLNRVGSAKDTRHVEVDLTDTGLKYRVGDALGIFPSNCDELVSEVITAANLCSTTLVSEGNSMNTLAKQLKGRCLRSIPSDLVERAIERVRNRPKYNGELVADERLTQQLTSFCESEELDTLDVLEFLERFPNTGLTELDLVTTLSPIRPRLYSIASSQSLFPNQVHLTVGRVENPVRNRNRKGVASTMLAERMQPEDAILAFIQPAHGFSIPKDPNAPMMMVGPGTGIAPFMAFLQQREFDKASGKNWLFFGDQRSAYDYLYEDQLTTWKSTGLLTRLDLAFSRDGAEKSYVQHRMKESGAELFAWLEEGGYFFVCGDASRMAVDVDRALFEIIAEHGKRTLDQARQYISELTKAKRYVRDVY